MKSTSIVKTAFIVCTVLSLIISSFLLFSVKDIPQYTRLIDSGKQIFNAVLEMEIQEKNYLLYYQEDVLSSVKEKIANLKKILSFHEKSTFTEDTEKTFEFAVWEEAMNLYERLFDQFVLYHQAVENNIAEIRNLEKDILAVIYSKMNPERGIIALQEIRIHEKGYLIYRNYPEPPDERSFEDKRKEAVANLLMWAQKDKRIEEFMDQDNKLFNEIIVNYKSQENTLRALKRESKRIINMAEKIFKRRKQKITYQLSPL